MKKSAFLLLPLLALAGCNRGGKASAGDVFALYDKAILRSSEKTSIRITTSTPMSLLGSLSGYDVEVQSLPLDFRYDGTNFSIVSGSNGKKGSIEIDMGTGFPLSIKNLAFGVYGDADNVYLDFSDSSFTGLRLTMGTALGVDIPEKIVTPTDGAGLEIDVGSMFSSMSAEPYSDFYANHANCFELTDNSFTLKIEDIDDLTDYIIAVVESETTDSALSSMGDYQNEIEDMLSSATLNAYSEKWKFDENGIRGFEALIDIEGLPETVNSAGGDGYAKFGFDFAYDGFTVETPSDKDDYQPLDLSGVTGPTIPGIYA